MAFQCELFFTDIPKHPETPKESVKTSVPWLNRRPAIEIHPLI